MAYRYQDEEDPRNPDLRNRGQFNSIEPDGAPIPEQAPAGPRISSGWGNSDPRGVEDMWFQFLNANGYAKGQSSRGNGFYQGGSAYRGNLGGIVDAFNQQTGLNARTVAGHDDMIDFGYGAQDVLTAGANDWWLGARGGVEPRSGGGTGAGVPQTGPVAPGPAVPTGPLTADRNNDLYEELLKRSQQGLDIDRNDPIIRAQADAYSANMERARRNFLSDNAEGSSMYATGAQLGQERMTAEKLGQATGGFEAELMGRELTSRRDEITHALDSMRDMLTNEQQMALQRELAALDAEIRRYGIDSENDRFYADLGLRRDDRQNYWDYYGQGIDGN